MTVDNILAFILGLIIGLVLIRLVQVIVRDMD